MATETESDLTTRLIAAEAALYALQHQEADAILGVDGVSYVRAKEAVERERQITQALRQSELRFRVALANSPVVVFEQDLDLRYTWIFNPKLGYAVEDVVGKTDAELMEPDCAANLTRLKRGVIDGGRPLREEIATAAPGGPLEYYDLYIEPRRDDAGRIVGVICAGTDITARKHAEAEIRRLNASLEQRVVERTAELSAANMELDSFAYAVTHDLRAPLRAMSGFSGALLEDYGDRLPEQGRGYLTHIARASLRMNELIDGLLVLSRNTRDELQHDRIDLSALALRILAEFSRGDADRQVAVEVEPGMAARGDARMIAVALQNLLGNAWKFTANSAAPTIRVYSEKRDGVTRFCVADNGAGFDMAHAGRLFLPFQRLHRQDEFPGLGIGLVTVQRIVQRHGGSIQAHGEPGKGALFSFSLGVTP